MLFRSAFPFLLLLAAAAAPMACGPGVLAQDKDAATLSSPRVVLTPEEQTEREGRRACKAALCAAFRNPANGQNVACSLTKSLRKEQLQRIVSRARVSWPWGGVVCTTQLRADRTALSQALGAAQHVVRFDRHEVACEIAHADGAPSSITAQLTPEVTFENGKAVRARINWGRVTGPTLVRGLMWTATATDNTLNVLGSMIVDDMNDFVTTKCDEVKDDWAGK